MKLTEELIQERIDKYIEDNESRILEDIDTRISKAINKAIREYFATGYHWERTSTAKYIKGEIEKLANEEANKLEIDTEEIQRLINKQVTQQVKNISVRIGERD